MPPTPHADPKRLYWHPKHHSIHPDTQVQVMRALTSYPLIQLWITMATPIPAFPQIIQWMNLDLLPVLGCALPRFRVTPPLLDILAPSPSQVEIPLEAHLMALI